jgi:hypothetical protein
MKKLYTALVIALLSINVFGQAPSLAWAEQIAGTNTNRAYAIAVDASGNVYSAGAFRGTEDFDP